MRSPAQDLSSSPESVGQAHGPAFGSATPGGAAGAALDLDLMQAAIQDGVLMVFGPDGDPVPPQAFAAAAAARPGALVAWADQPGTAVEADRVAAVLEAQREGRLGSEDDGDVAWIEAMLGIGPQPEMAADDDLLAEGHEVEIVAFGKEMMISSPAGGTFLIAEARSTSPASVGLRGPDGEPVALGAVVAHLLGRVHRGGAARAKVNEVALPACRTWIEDEALIIDLPEVGTLHFVRGDPADPGPSVSVFMPDGETATIDQLLEALSRPLTSPDDEALAHEDTTPPAAACSGAGDPASAPQGPPARPPRQVPVSIGMPKAFAASAGDVALLVVRGLPHGATLSAGAASGDGSWLLSPRDLAGLALAPPPGWTLDLALEIAAIAIQDRDGKLASASNILQVPLHAGASGRGQAPVPVVIDPEALRDHTARLDAIVVRDLPAEARLSAGAYDPEIDGWVLLPRQLHGLTVTPGVEQTEDFSLTLLAITLEGGQARSRLVTRIPVAIG